MEGRILMRYLIAVIAALILFTGCSEHPGEETVTDEEYAEMVREMAPGLADVDTDTLVLNAELICDSFDNGMSAQAVAEILISNGMSVNETGTLLAGAVFYKCPEHEDLLQ